MTNINDFLERLEHEVRTLRASSESSCLAFASLPWQSRVAYAASMRFLGCTNIDSPTKGNYEVPEPHRVMASRLMLLSLYLDTDSPRWSSWVLDRLLESVMATPGGTIGDLLHALMDVLSDEGIVFTEYVANLIKTLVIKSFTKYRSSFNSADLRWMLDRTAICPTSAKAYLAILAIPPSIMDARCARSILRELASTPYFEQAINTLEDELDRGDVDAARKMTANSRPEDSRGMLPVGIERAGRDTEGPPAPEATLAKLRTARTDGEEQA